MIEYLVEVLGQHRVETYADKWICSCGMEVSLDDGVLGQVPPEQHIAMAIAEDGGLAEEYEKRAIVEPLIGE